MKNAEERLKVLRQYVRDNRDDVAEELAKLREKSKPVEVDPNDEVIEILKQIEKHQRLYAKNFENTPPYNLAKKCILLLKESKSKVIHHREDGYYWLRFEGCTEWYIVESINGWFEIDEKDVIVEIDENRIKKMV